MIRVKEYYSGRLTEERMIAPGVYANDDPALFGLVQWLLERGVAETVDDVVPALAPVKNETTGFIGMSHDQFISLEGRTEAPLTGEVSGAAGEIPDDAAVTYWENEAPVPAKASRDEPATVDYSALTIAELKALLDERGVDYGDARRKDDYVALAQAEG